MQQYEDLVEHFRVSLNDYDHLETRLTTILNNIEKCSNLTGDEFTIQARQCLNVYHNENKYFIFLSFFSLSL